MAKRRRTTRRNGLDPRAWIAIALVVALVIAYGVFTLNPANERVDDIPEQALDDLGFDLSDDEVQVAFEAFKDVADRKGEVSHEDVRAIVLDHTATSDVEGHELASFQCSSTPDASPTATVTIRPAGGGEYVTATADGDGMVDAACAAIRQAIGRDDIHLTVFNVGAVTEGIDALATVTITIEVDGTGFTGRGVSTDVVEASARAFLDAINRSERITKRHGEFRV